MFVGTVGSVTLEEATASISRKASEGAQRPKPPKGLSTTSGAWRCFGAADGLAARCVGLFFVAPFNDFAGGAPRLGTRLGAGAGRRLWHNQQLRHQPQGRRATQRPQGGRPLPRRRRHGLAPSSAALGQTSASLVAAPQPPGLCSCRSKQNLRSLAHRALAPRCALSTLKGTVGRP